MPPTPQPIGNTWLRQTFRLENVTLLRESYLGGRTLRSVDGERVVEFFHGSYAIPDDPLEHIQFALKYDHLDLRLLRAVFQQLPAAQIEAFVAAAPTGKYARQIGFLYEFLTGAKLPLAGVTIGGPYVPILDTKRYIVADPIKVQRWRIDDNLLGPAEFSPLVRRTPAIEAAIARDWKGEIRAIVDAAPPELVFRALTYLYLKETSSSFLIEREEPGPQRSERFVGALRAAGQVTPADSLTEGRLTALQNTIVNTHAESQPAQGYRRTQNFVAENAGPRKRLVHYISPAAEMVPSLMHGLASSSDRLATVPPGIHAAVVAFQFVYVHPFDDGNGRIHRFLIHDILSRREFVRDSLILPVSATMLKDKASYDRALERFSVPLMKQIEYDIDLDGRLTVKNPAQIEPAWRYPDLTAQVEYLHQVVEDTIAAIPAEFEYLRKYDQARTAIAAEVTMPQQRLASLLDWLDDGGGRLSNNKRKQFAELTPAQLSFAENAYAEAFGSGPRPVPATAVALNERPKV